MRSPDDACHRRLQPGWSRLADLAVGAVIPLEYAAVLLIELVAAEVAIVRGTDRGPWPFLSDHRADQMKMAATWSPAR